MNSENCFITLTYSPENVPENGSLNKRDIQLFMKRLRKKYRDKKIRYFQCGEYGGQLGRPHHHVILFGHNFTDRKHFSSRGKIKLYLSQELSDLWPHGMHTIGELTLESAAYTAAYILKKVFGKKAPEHYGDKIPEFITMSRRPGIGQAFYDRYKSDLYTTDQAIITDTKRTRVPKYYDKLFDLQHPARLQALKSIRKTRAKANPDNHPLRLAIREQIKQIQQEKKQRCYETFT